MTSTKKYKLSKKSFLNIVFGRAMVVIVLLMVQLGILAMGYYWLAQNFFYYYGLTVLLSIVTLVIILNEYENSAFKISWIIPVLIFPVFGALFYIFCKIQPGVKRINLMLEEFDNEARKLFDQTKILNDRKTFFDKGEEGLSKYLYTQGVFPAYSDTKIKFFPTGEKMFQDILEAINEAEKYIFMEYFIIGPGYMWDSILEALIKKVEQGVEVRVMYDGMCSFALLPYDYYKKLETLGIKSCVFSQIKPVLSTHQNNRDHRKILVIDGKYGYTGGINLADEYINKIEKFGYWKDTAVKLTGNAVKSLTMMFLQLWNVNYPVKDDFSKYLVENEKVVETDEIVIPYADGPYNNEQIGKEVYIDILNRASRYVHIMTPYLILDDELVGALTFAAKRGVEVVILMPHIPDKKYPYLLARTYYYELICNGVKIYEFTPGFLHAKEFISDDIRGTVGSFNLDYRSMYLHYECGVYIYNNSVIEDMEKDFQNTLEESQQVTLKGLENYSKWGVIVGRVMRLFAPFM